MRIFEIVLLVGITLWLLVSMKKQPKSILLGAAVFNVVVLILLGGIEGFRYQMAPAYILVALLAAITSLKAACGFKDLRTPGWIKVPAFILALIFLAVSAFVSTALPVFSLPRPTGNHAVGVQYFHLIDQDRLDPFLDGTTRQRELMIKVFYPTQEVRAKPYMRYFRGSPEMIRAFASFYNMPAFMFDHLRLVRTGAKEGLPLSNLQDTYPVVLFSHGAGTSMEVQTSQSEDLASHGYIVVAVDHTFVSSATEFPERVVRHQEATTDFHTPEPVEIITQIMTDDLRYVMDTLGEMDRGARESIFQGRLNLDQTGVIGHSVGGAVAYNLAISDPRIKAAINMDGVVYRTPEAGVDTIAPFLMIASDGEHVQAIRNQRSLMRPLNELPDIDQSIMFSMYGSEAAYQEAYAKARQNAVGLAEVLRASKSLYTITGSDHMRFTDIGLFLGLQPIREMMGIRGQLEPTRCLAITQSLARTYFDRHLKGEVHYELDTLLETYPELQRVDIR